MKIVANHGFLIFPSSYSPSPSPILSSSFSDFLCSPPFTWWCMQQQHLLSLSLSVANLNSICKASEQCSTTSRAAAKHSRHDSSTHAGGAGAAAAGRQGRRRRQAGACAHARHTMGQHQMWKQKLQRLHMRAQEEKKGGAQLHAKQDLGVVK